MEGPETMAALEDFDCALLNVAVKGELGLETGLSLPNNLVDDGLPEEITKEIFALEDEDRDIPFRSRCNTWPRLQNPINLFNAHQSVNDNPDSVDSGVSTESTRLQVTKYEDEKAYSPSSLPGGGGTPLPLVNEEDPENDSGLGSRGAEPASTPPPHAMRPKMSSRRNPWGNMSYADLITQAIQSSPNQRLTLAQIYEWLVKNVTYFQNKGDNVSSLGWKNSIRHNLSLHNKFMRVQNEGAGKSSWWMLNPEESKPIALTKPTRRRANTLDSTTKFSARRGQRTGKRRDSFSGRTPNKDLKQSPSQNSLQPEVQLDFSTPHGSNQSPEYGRPRTSSNASSCGRLSPFRPRTLSNTSSTCDYNSPSQDNSCDGMMPISSWNQPSPVAQFQEKLNLNENSNHETPMEEDEHDKLTDGTGDRDPLKYIELNDLDLEPLMSKILAAAAEESLAVQNATSQQQQQQQKQQQQQQQQLSCTSVQSSTSVTIPSSLPTADSPANLLNVQPTLSSLTVLPEQLRTTGIARQPSPQLPPQLCLPQDHIQGQSMGLVDDKAFQELREIQMEQQELVDQTISTTLAFSQALPHKIKILEQRDLPSNRPLVHGSQDIPKPWDHTLRTDGQDQSPLGRSLPNAQSVFETNRFRPTSPDLPPAFIRSTSAETLVSSPQGANFPPVTNNSFLNTALASQPLSTLSESMDESPYYEEFMKTEISSSDLTDFDFGLVSALDSALASETSSSQPNSFHQIML